MAVVPLWSALVVILSRGPQLGRRGGAKARVAAKISTRPGVSQMFVVPPARDGPALRVEVGGSVELGNCVSDLEFRAFDHWAGWCLCLALRRCQFVGRCGGAVYWSGRCLCPASRRLII